jgi:hypothetical protein
MMRKEVQNMDHQLLADIKQMIEHTRQTVGQTVNSGLTLRYWNIGRRINDEILEELRAEYGKRILQTLSAKLVNEFGNGFSQRNLKNMIDFAVQFPDLEIVASLSRQLELEYWKGHSEKN